MSKVSVGYFIRRTVKDVDATRGKTFAAYGHALHHSRDRAQAALDDLLERRALDRRFAYDICEAFMEIPDDPG